MAGPAGDDNQVRTVKSSQEFIQAGKAGKYKRHGLTGLSFRRCGGFKIFVQYLTDRNKVPWTLPVAQLIQGILGSIQAGINIGVGFITDGGNLVSRTDETAH